ncbi:hypothetical protein TSUD_145900 [Trifolium subterraneum]|uniref:Retrotransposon gag domain-containing protein n=1 Tax=Trifolium subterraneum TaxID=3900 RepID=A0A2Z6NQT1_TRISU|nr:hypothetical protein TSUD_145900 [Trifolium subterraneum]
MAASSQDSVNMGAILSALSEKLDSLASDVASLRNGESPPLHPPPPPPAHNNHPKPHMKLKVPKFDGSDAIGWIFKINQFFDFHQTPDPDRLTIASFYMDGPALGWFQWITRSGMIQSWPEFLMALETRFALSFYDDPRGALFKLTQRGTINQYLTEFERLVNRVETALAKIQEDKIADRRKTFKPHHTFAPTPAVNNTPVNATSPPPSVSKPPSKIPFRKLSPEEIASRRERNLCYNCDETFSPQHRLESAPTTDAQLSLHAMSGSINQNTFRILGTIAKQQVTILVDSGSTQNFIQDRVAKFLGLSITLAPHPFRVMVGNGSTLECAMQCTGVNFIIQGNHFTSDFFVLPLGGAEVVLGVPWLTSLGPILVDYTTLLMRFTHLGQPIELKADAPFKPKDISAPQMKRCVSTNSVSFFLHLQHILDLSLEAQSTIPEIQTLLTRYQTLFHPPSSLPPQRTHDHRNHLIPDAAPVNVRPYRYPYFQKSEIEKQTAELLQSGMIRPSRSPFSSPVLLVKKKDGTWRCCIDYRALNAITVKDRFPMPTIDELLDDIGSASWFSKLGGGEDHEVAVPGPPMLVGPRLLHLRLRLNCLLHPLIIWLGLPPEETSWEKWSELQATYHLEDKVTFHGEGIDSDNTMGTSKGGVDINTTTRNWPKRIPRRPIHLNDYVPK